MFAFLVSSRLLKIDLLGIKKPQPITRLGLKVASTYSPTLKRAVPSAQVGLTSLFGMGRGGPYCNKHLKLEDFKTIGHKIRTNWSFLLSDNLSSNVLVD